MGAVSPVRTRTPTYYLDFTLQPGSSLTQEIPSGWTTFVYTLRGRIEIGGDLTVEPHHTVLFTREGEAVQIENRKEEEAQLIMIAGKPLGETSKYRTKNIPHCMAGEPVARHGPFVMNTKQELEQAFQDFHRATNGFERAKTWRSVSGNT